MLGLVPFRLTWITGLRIFEVLLLLAQRCRAGVQGRAIRLESQCMLDRRVRLFRIRSGRLCSVALVVIGSMVWHPVTLEFASSFCHLFIRIVIIVHAACLLHWHETESGTVPSETIPWHLYFGSSILPNAKAWEADTWAMGCVLYELCSQQARLEHREVVEPWRRIAARKSFVRPRT